MHITRVLIIEDHEPTRNLLRSIFRRRGFDVTAVGTIAEGLTLLDQDPLPDSLLLDLDLPDGCGETILRKIREDRLPVRVAVCTGMGDSSRWSTIQSLNPEALLQKPVGITDICMALA
jgi:DNA-binding response OmpR family regulator